MANVQRINFWIKIIIVILNFLYLLYASDINHLDSVRSSMGVLWAFGRLLWRNKFSEGVPGTE